jgi:hypothetical protein
MNAFGLYDLDELILTVKNKTSKMYILEAINAYRGKAYKAAIMSTWIAVSYDIIAKIRELAGQNNKTAISFVKDLDSAITNGNIPQQSTIESSLLEKAKDEFEFISKHEFEDLERLKTDRNNCAHPAFVDIENLFQPTPEIARAHIVHAVLHLLQHHPTQGKSAIERILNDIRQPSFPSDKKSVTEFLVDKYLRRAKESLIRNLVIVLLKLLLKNDDPDFKDKGELLANCLFAIYENFPMLYEEVQSGKLSGIIETLDDEHLANIFTLINADVNCWAALTESARIQVRGKLMQCLNSGFPEYYQHKFGILGALQIQEINEFAMSEFSKLDQSGQSLIISANPLPQFADIAIKIFLNSSSFASAKQSGDFVLLPMAHHLTPRQIEQVLDGIPKNKQNQILPAHGMTDTLEKFFQVTIDKLDETKDSWAKLAKELSFKPYSSMYKDLLERLRQHKVIG